jgi:hypothetical protein
MNEYLMRRRLMDGGMTYDEADAELDSRASDAYDQEQDRKAEQYFKEKANEDQDK